MKSTRSYVEEMRTTLDILSCRVRPAIGKRRTDKILPGLRTDILFNDADAFNHLARDRFTGARRAETEI